MKKAHPEYRAFPPSCPDPLRSFIEKLPFVPSGSWSPVSRVDDRRKRQTFAATPAEPGDLPWGLGAAAAIPTPRRARRDRRSAVNCEENLPGRTPKPRKASGPPMLACIMPNGFGGGVYAAPVGPSGSLSERGGQVP
jgi:hypothetical protein